MDRADWLLLFLSNLGDSERRPRSLEPLRIMKGMFLASKRGAGELSGLYEFEAYDYGPFTKDIYHDLDELAAAGLVVQEAVAGRSWRTYRPTELGMARAQSLGEPAAAAAKATLADAYQYVTSRGFLRLLRDIYAEFPEYAVNTVVRDAAPGAR